MTQLSFTVYGVAQPKGSARAFIPKGWTRPIITSANPKHKGWQQLVAEAASRALATVDFHHHGPIRVIIDFYLARPKSIKARIQPHLTNPDLDKLARSVLDALTGVLWNDDAQVIELHATKSYTHIGESPRAVILVAALGQQPLLERTDTHGEKAPVRSQPQQSSARIKTAPTAAQSGPARS